MPLQITDESYNSLPALYANAGKTVTGSVKFRNCYRFGSGNSLKLRTYGDYAEIESGEWKDYGFSDGDSVTFYFRKLTGAPATQFVNFSMTVAYVNGNKMYFTASLNAAYQNKVYPTDGQLSGMFVRVNKQPVSVDFRFNLALQGTGSLSSVIDDELNRFINNTIQSLAVSGSASMTQLGNKSGGLVESVTITRNADTTFSATAVLGTATEYNYTIAFTFVQWGVFKDDNQKPVYYFADQCLQPIIEISSFPQVNTPNGKMTDTNGAKFSNVGWFDENYNGYPSAYTLTSLVLTDTESPANTLEQIAYNKTTSFTAVFSAPNQLNGTSVYRIGMCFTPTDETLYKNLPTAWKNNVLLNTPDVNYQHSASPDTTNRVGNTNSSGAGFDFDNLKFSHSANVLTVTGDIIPTTASEAFFDEIADGGRNLMAWVQISDHTKTGQLNDEVNVLFYNDDCYSAPRIGVQWPDVEDDTILDHAGNDVTSTVTPNLTTEDNVLYTGRFLVDEDTEIENIRVAMLAYNSSTGEQFTLEYIDFSTAGVPFISGIYEFNNTVNRGFLLPPTSDRNIVSITRDSSLDAGGQYGLKIQYGFLNDWRYWLEQSNVDDSLFDSAEPNNGKNKNWQRLQNGDWSLRIGYFIRIDGVDDYNYTPVIVRSYEDDPNVTTTYTYTDAEGNSLTALPSSGIVDAEVVLEWNNNFSSEWAEVTAENFEGGRIGFISTEHDHSGQTPNCLVPSLGQTRLQKTVSTNNLKLNFRVDCNQLPSSAVSLTYRCFSLPKEMYGFPITFRKDAALAYSVYKISSDEVWSGPLMRIQRSSDNTEMDIYATPSGLMDVNVAETFAGVGDARVSILYDQSGSGCHATQTTYANMAEIVKAGSIVLDADNNLPTWKYTGATSFYNLAYALQQGEEFTQISVLKRATGQQSVTLGSDTGLTALWDATGIDDIITFFGSSPYVLGSEATTATSILSVVHKDTDLSYYELNGSGTGIGGDTTLIKSMMYLNRYSTNYGKGNAQEIIVWQKDKSLELAALTSNIQNRF